MSVIAESFGRSAYLLPGDCSPEAKLVKAALVEQGLETPMIENGLTRDEKYSRIRESM
jgi:GTP cyclohydrolase I